MVDTVFKETALCLGKSLVVMRLSGCWAAGVL